MQAIDFDLDIGYGYGFFSIEYSWLNWLYQPSSLFELYTASSDDEDIEEESDFSPDEEEEEGGVRYDGDSSSNDGSVVVGREPYLFSVDRRSLGWGFVSEMD